jgi:ferredoxin/flavodoxin---NADP+ reductase
VRTSSFDLIVVGAGPTGLSLAASAERRGVERVLVVEPGQQAFPAEAVARYGITVRFGFEPVEICLLEGGGVLVESETESLRGEIVIVVESSAGAPPPFAVPPSLDGRVHLTPGAFEPMDQDVLLVASGDEAVGVAEQLMADGARVVLVFDGNAKSLSRVAGEAIAEMEHGRRLTVLWDSTPDALDDVGGYPMAFFDDRRTPDLQFDHVVVLKSSGSLSRSDGALYHIDSMAPPSDPLAPANAWRTISEAHTDVIPPPVLGWVATQPDPEVRQLRLDHYNATITRFDHSHEDLWVIRVKPDQRDSVHRPGQYATLGLGYWEPRVDDVDEKLTDDRRRKLIRRSYSISSRIFDDHGYLVDDGEEDEIEFYIVHVRPDGDRIPGLTPRLAAMRVGDRIYLGPKIAGRYTLDPVVDPETDVVFLATGTGEAPHNAMVTELLRKGHRGAIASVVTVRYLRDLGYLDQHRTLERFHPNYHYVALPTREDGVEKRYIQDFVESGDLAGLLDHDLDPARTHVFLCGNPAMIGLPEWDDGTPSFPAPRGVTEILHDRGFVIDRRGVIGNVHYEEYW